MFCMGGEPEVLLPDFTMEEITDKVSGIFDQQETQVETKLEIVKDRTITESATLKLEPQSDFMESDFVDDEMYDDPLMTEAGNERENFKEDPSYEIKTVPKRTQNTDNELETGFSFPIEFDLQVANDKFSALMEEVKSKSEKTVIDGKERFHCGLCDEICAQLPIHVGRNHAELNFKCSQCPMAVGSGNLLRLHEKVHLAQPVPCKICGKEVKDIKKPYASKT